MLFAKWPRAITTLLLCVFIHVPVNAQSLYSMQQKLSGYEKQLAALKTRQQEIQETLDSNAVKLKNLDNRSSPEKDKLKEAKRQLQQATIAHRNKPTSDNEAKKSNAEFKLALAERKFKKANSRQIKLQEKTDALAQELDTVDKDISRLTAAIAGQKQAISRQKQQMATADKILNEQKQRAQEAEIKRLKAELEQQKQLQAQEAAKEKELAAQKRLQTQKAANVVAETKQMALSVAKKNGAAAKAPATAVAKAAAATAPKATSKSKAAPALSSQSQAAILLTTRKQVQKEDRRMAKLLTKRTKKRSRVNKVLDIKSVSANGAIGKPESHTLRALGREQYKSVVHLNGGDILFGVGTNTWRTTIPADDSGKEHMIVYDASKSEQPRLLVFEKALTARTRILKKR